jgi:predicted Fe-Mo cluster-binding NifX family protein
MKIAATYENGRVFAHFGHTAQFKIYEAENGQVKHARVVDTNGTGHGALAGMLTALGVDVLICGGIGGGAQQALARAGIALCAGVEGDTDAAVESYLKGTLQYAQSANCDHHHEGETHECGAHGCGEHGCGEHGCHGN